MSDAYIAHLSDRAAVAVTGADAVKFLNGIVTSDASQLEAGEAVHAGLLSPQGKILFEFLAVRTPDGFVLDVARDRAADLVKRLTMYKLRAAVTIADAREQYASLALWGAVAVSSGETVGTLSFRDPRHEALGRRILAERAFAEDIASATNGKVVSEQAYHAHRVALGVPEGGKDYEFGDTYPHEADFDLFHGVSFKKGCYVGQEVVARMQHKTVVRKRVVRVLGDADLVPASDVMHKGVVIGRTGSVSGRSGLALLKLDRYADAINGAEPVMAGAARIRVHEDDLERYLTAAQARERN